MQIPTSYWRNEKVNAERIEQFLPPLPNKLPFHPAERRVALIETLVEQNPMFSQNLQYLASEIFTNILADAIKDGGDDILSETDDDGFQPVSLDGRLDEENGADS